METTKTKFQTLLSEMESLLENFKNAYPKNYGDILQRWMPFLMLMVAVLAAVNLHYTPNDTLIFGAGFVPFVVFFLFLKYHKRHIRVDYTELERKIITAKEEYGEYPDAVKYLNKTYEVFTAETAHKKHMKKVMNTVIWGLFAIATIVTIIRINHFHLLRDEFDLVLDVQEKPLTSIKPLTTKAANNIKLPAGKLNLYCGSVWYRPLEIETPDFIYADGNNSGNNYYLITITDQDGNPIPKCPDFYFNSFNSGHIEAIPRFHLKNHLNSVESLQLMFFIQENADNLRYVVEKL